MPKVSIIISTYNDAQNLPKALESVIGQTFADYELLIANDASTDETQNILAEYQKKDSRIIFWTNQNNLGLTANLNEGIKRSKGEYIARLDSDDEWSDKEKLKKQVEFLDKHPNVALVGTRAKFLDQKLKRSFIFMPPLDDQNIRKQILIRNCFAHSSVMFRKNIATELGGYPVDQKYIEDYALWLKMGTTSKLWNLPEIMVNYKISQTSITQTKNLEQIRSILSLIKIFKENYPNYFWARLKWKLQLLIKIFKSS